MLVISFCDWICWFSGSVIFMLLSSHLHLTSCICWLLGVRFKKCDNDVDFKPITLLGDWWADFSWFTNSFDSVFWFWYGTDSRIVVCVLINVLSISSLDISSFCKKMFSSRISSVFFSVLDILVRLSNRDSSLLLHLREMHNALQLPVFFLFSFFSWLCQRYLVYREIQSKKLFHRPLNSQGILRF